MSSHEEAIAPPKSAPINTERFKSQLTLAMEMLLKKDIIRDIMNFKVRAYLFGGMIRDMIAGETPNDHDVMIIGTRETFEEILCMLKKKYRYKEPVGYSEFAFRVVQIAGCDICLVVEDMPLSIDFTANSLAVEIEKESECLYSLQSVIALHSVVRRRKNVCPKAVEGCIDDIINKKMVIATDRWVSPIHQLYRICKMFTKGYRNDSTVFVEDLIDRILYFKRHIVDDDCISTSEANMINVITPALRMMVPHYSSAILDALS